MNVKEDLVIYYFSWRLLLLSGPFLGTSSSNSILTEGDLVSSNCPDLTAQMKAIRKTVATTTLNRISRIITDIRKLSWASDQFPDLSHSIHCKGSKKYNRNTAGRHQNRGNYRGQLPEDSETHSDNIIKEWNHKAGINDLFWNMRKA